MKKKGIIIGCAAVVILAAATLVLMNLDFSDNASVTEEKKTVLALDDAESIVVTDGGNVTAKYVKAEDSEQWTIEGLDPSDISSAKMQRLISCALNYETKLVIDEPGELSDYGLDDAKTVITIKEKHGEHTLFIGDHSAVDDVYFVLYDGSDGDIVFTMDEAQYDMLTKDKSYFTEFSRISLNPDNISEIKIETADRTIDVYLPEEFDVLEGNVWQMRSPYEIMANDSFLDSDVLEQLGMLTLSKKTDSIGKERAKLTVKDDKDTYVLKIGDTAGGVIKVEYQGAAYEEASELLKFIDADTFSYVNKLVSYAHVQKISEVTAEYDGKKHTLSVSGENKNLSFKADGEAAEVNGAKALYTSIIGVVAVAFYNNERTGDTILKINFATRDNNDNMIVEYKRVNDYTAAVFVNDRAIFVTAMADVENLKKIIDEYFERK